MSGRLSGAALGAVLLVGCAPTGGVSAPDAADPGSSTASASPVADPVVSVRPSLSRTPSPSPPEDQTTPSPPPMLSSDGAPRDAVLGIEALDILDLEVESYEGSPDDAAGNYGRDEFGDPEHRMDEVGVLTAVEHIR